MAYVGLTDAFNASVCLFHHTFGGTPEEYMFTTHTRNGKHLQKRKKLQCGLGERVPSSMWKELPVDIEPLDMELYVSHPATLPFFTTPTSCCTCNLREPQGAPPPSFLPLRFCRQAAQKPTALLVTWYT